MLSAALLLAGCQFSKGHSAGGGGGSPSPGGGTPPSPPTLPAASGGFLSTLSVAGEAGVTLHLTSQPRSSGTGSGDGISQSPSFGGSDTIRVRIESTVPSSNPLYQLQYDGDGDGTYEDSFLSVAGNTDRALLTVSGKAYAHARVGADSTVSFDIDGDSSDDGRIYLRAITNRNRAGGTSYLAGGAWLYAPDDASANDYVLGAVASGVTSQAGSEVLALTGSATYSGAAVGIYSGSGGVGEFEAQVNLNADFGTNTEPGSVSGTMSNFTGSDGGSLAGTLTLGSANLAAGNPVFTGAISGSGSTFSGVSGNWGGRLFAYLSDPSQQPRGIGGTVGGGVAADNFYFAGAYIAEKD